MQDSDFDEKTLSKIDRMLFDEFVVIQSQLSPEKLIFLVRPVFQSPNLMDQIREADSIKELGNNKWFMTYKPKLTLELRLRYAASIIEGQLKNIFFLLEAFLRKAKNMSFQNFPGTLGSSINLINDNIETFNGYPTIKSYMSDFEKLHEL